MRPVAVCHVAPRSWLAFATCTIVRVRSTGVVVVVAIVLCVGSIVVSPGVSVTTGVCRSTWMFTCTVVDSKFSRSSGVNTTVTDRNVNELEQIAESCQQAGVTLSVLFESSYFGEDHKVILTKMSKRVEAAYISTNNVADVPLLMVEDDANVAVTLAERLRASGFVVRHAASVAAAREAIAGGLFDVALATGRLMAPMFPMVMFVVNASSVAVLWFGALRLERKARLFAAIKFLNIVSFVWGINCSPAAFEIRKRLTVDRLELNNFKYGIGCLGVCTIELIEEDNFRFVNLTGTHHI